MKYFKLHSLKSNFVAMLSIKYWMIVIFCFFSTVHNSHAASSDTTYVVYVSLQGDNAIVLYQMNPQSGVLNKIYSEPISGGPASLASDPENQYLYVARRSAKAISAYRIDQMSGQLTLINSIAAVDNPVYISTDQGGKFLLSAYFGASKAAVYPIDTNGGLNSNASQLNTTGLNPHAIVTDPSNQYLYITNMTGNKIMQNSFNEQAGTFTTIDPAEVIPTDEAGPRHMVFHGSKNVLYVVNETGNSVTAYRINQSSGALTSFQTVSTLPANFSGTSKCADIHIAPNNRFLYASNRGHGSITAFRIDSHTDSLISTGNFATVASPREFDIDPSGNYLYAAGESTNNLTYYRINSTNGSLDSLGSISVGKNPTWVRTVQLVNEANSKKHQLQLNTSDLEFGNFPNPFIEMTSIHFSVNQTSKVKLSICNISGHLIAKLYDEELAPGSYSTNWKPKPGSLKPGIYICTLETKNGNKTIKLIKK